MQPMRASTQFAAEGFGGSKFSPMKRAGALNLGPVTLSQGDRSSLAPAPSVTLTPTTMGAVIQPEIVSFPQVAPIIRTPLVYPPAIITPTGQVLVTESDVSSDENKVIAVLVALGLFGLGASLF